MEGKKNAAWVITPLYRSASDFTNDIAWLGASPSWTAFGKGYQAWFEEAGRLAEKFNDVYKILKYLDGVFAFSIYHKKNHELYLYESSAAAINAPALFIVS